MPQREPNILTSTFLQSRFVTAALRTMATIKPIDGGTVRLPFLRQKYITNRRL